VFDPHLALAKARLILMNRENLDKRCVEVMQSLAHDLVKDIDMFIGYASQCLASNLDRQVITLEALDRAVTTFFGTKDVEEPNWYMWYSKVLIRALKVNSFVKFTIAERFWAYVDAHKSDLDPNMFSRYLYHASEGSSRDLYYDSNRQVRSFDMNFFTFLLNKGADPYEVFPSKGADPYEVLSHKRTTALSEAQEELRRCQIGGLPTAALLEVIEMMEQMASFRIRNPRTWKLAWKRLRRQK